MTAARKMRPLHEMYSQDEIERATAYVTRVYKKGPDDIEDNPVAGWADFANCSNSTKLVAAATRAVLARRWHAVNGPQDADLQPLPLGCLEMEDAKLQSEAGRMLAWYSRSLAHNDYDIQRHPSFYEYACGILALGIGAPAPLEELGHRFPPRLLPGLDKSTVDWDPPLQDGGSR
jgi:hypothetical protein